MKVKRTIKCDVDTFKVGDIIKAKHWFGTVNAWYRMRGKEGEVEQ